MSVKNKDFLLKKNHTFLDPYQEWTPKGAKMAPEKPRNDPQILTTPKIFDFYHQTLTLKFLYRGSTIYLIRTFLIVFDMFKPIFGLWTQKSHSYKMSLKNKDFLSKKKSPLFGPLSRMDSKRGQNGPPKAQEWPSYA